MAEQNRFPVLYDDRLYTDIGGLMSFGADGEDRARRAMEYVDMILKGKKAGDLPIYQADKFQLIVNLKTAKVLGITLPPTLLARADEVIE